MLQKQIGEPILTADGITLAFGGITALNAISFEIRAHEILAIIGPNGAGKTSMLNVINGFYHPQAGTITWKGETRRQMRPYHAGARHRPHFPECRAVSRNDDARQRHDRAAAADAPQFPVAGAPCRP